LEPSFVKVNNDDNFMKVPVYNDANRTSVISIPSERKSMESETLFKKFRSITNKDERFKERVSNTCMVIFINFIAKAKFESPSNKRQRNNAKMQTDVQKRLAEYRRKYLLQRDVSIWF
jgi:hypothetical protein